jgi:hypothetical protein
MEIILTILLVLVSIIVLLLLTAIFIKNDYAIRREITINKAQQEVYNFIKFLKNQERYSKWVMADPNMKKEFKGTDGNVGFVYAWDSTDKNVGQGEQEIISLTEGKKVEAEIRFIKPFEGIATTSMVIDALSESQTRVSWGMMGKSKYPMNLMNPFMDNLLGKDLQISLTNLKQIFEK